ncbi:hypothetical protein GYH30_052679 [Glycine max]|nr:hypothetical protein GYH30_052679 [Glycine max]
MKRCGMINCFQISWLFIMEIMGASFFEQNQCTAISACIRDNTGTFLVAKSEWKNSCLKVLEGESWALWSALTLVNDLYLSNIYFESDCKIFVDKINGKGKDVSKAGVLIS